MSHPTSRRQFLKHSAGAAALASLSAAANSRAADHPRNLHTAQRRIKLGLVGAGVRGAWIARLFQAHGGYELWAVADYFPHVAAACGAELGVPAERHFSTLSGYKRLIESGVEAVALETLPYFMPEQAVAAVEAGLHVYMAKPVAVDVPGALQVRAAGERACRQGTAFLIDYQIPTDPANREVIQRIHAGGLGRLAQVRTAAVANNLVDPPRTANLESRLQNLVWLSDVALGCDSLGNYDIHALDAALWGIGQPPVAAAGCSEIARADPHGDARDVCAVVFEYANGIVHNHYGQNLRNNAPTEGSAAFHGTDACAAVAYGGRVYLRGGPRHFVGEVKDLYRAGAERNIARFHREIVAEDFSNATLERSVNGVIMSVLGREAAWRRTRLTWDTVVNENRRLEIDLSGLKS